MNILQLVPKLNIGGVEKGTIDLARYLTLNGHKAVVVSGGGIFEKELAAIGARHYSIPVGSKNPFVICYCYFRLIHVIRKENINIVHARSRIPALTGYFAAKYTGRIFITTAHGQYKKHLISRVMGWGKIVIAANDTMACYMKENFSVPMQKIRIVPRGVDLKKFSFVDIEQRKSRKVRIAMICRFTPLKGHLDFLKAASYISRRIHNLEIILMGDISSAKEEYMNKIHLTIKRLLLESIVILKDSSEDVSKVMKDIDIFVSANREQEAFGRTLIEAQARGVPVVATRVGGVVENVIDEETGLLCEPCDPSDMADRILRYITDPDLVKRVTLNARKNVEKKYSLEQMMVKTLEVYSDVLNMKKILIFKISALGDIILAVPSIRAIRKNFRNAVIKVLVDYRFREVLENCPYIDEIIACDLKSRDNGIGFLRLAGKLRSEDFDLSVDLQNSRKSHLLSAFSMIPERYGFDNKKFSFLINRKISLPKKAAGPVDQQALVLGLLGITGIEENLELWTDKTNEEWAEKYLQNIWKIKGQKLVGISLSASRKWQTKNWGISNLSELSEMLAREKNIRVMLFGAEEDMQDAKKFSKKTDVKAIDVVGKTTLSQFISLIKKCDALITGDSAPMHMAAAVKVPFVSIFGPTSPEKHLPPAGKYRVLYKKIKCSPCYKPVCSKKMKCLKNIRPREVFDALMEII